MRLSTRCFALASILISITAGAATPLPTTAPENVWFSKEGLARIDQFFAREIAADRVPGAVIAIARDGKLVHYKAYGALNKATGEAMPLDAIFNLASMTKVMGEEVGRNATRIGARNALRPVKYPRSTDRGAGGCG